MLGREAGHQPVTVQQPLRDFWGDPQSEGVHLGARGAREDEQQGLAWACEELGRPGTEGVWAPSPAENSCLGARSWREGGQGGGGSVPGVVPACVGDLSPRLRIY